MLINLLGNWLIAWNDLSTDMTCYISSGLQVVC